MMALSEQSHKSQGSVNSIQCVFRYLVWLTDIIKAGQYLSTSSYCSKVKLKYELCHLVLIKREEYQQGSKATVMSSCRYTCPEISHDVSLQF